MGIAYLIAKTIGSKMENIRRLIRGAENAII
jgi:hypothetical protein